MLYLMRHGIAAPAGWGQSDTERVLTPEGMLQVQRIAQTLAAVPVQIERLFCSPYLRARQTAEVIGAALGHTPEVEALLHPGTSLDDLFELLQRYPAGEPLMIVAHQPALGRMVQDLTGSRVAMQPATLAAIRITHFRAKCSTLRGLYAPDFLAQLSPKKGT